MQRQTHAHVHSQMKTPSPSSHGGSTMRSGLEQRDRSLTVMIPRAKYRPASQQAPPSILTMSTFGPEQKAMSYNMDPRQTPTKVNRYRFAIIKCLKYDYNVRIFFYVM